MEQYNNGDYFSVDLVRLIKIIWKNKLKIIIFSLMISLLVGLYTMEFVPYKYKSSTTIYLSNYNEKYQFNNQITSEVKNKDSIKSVIESQKLNISTEELLKNLKVNFDDQNKSITMTYSSTDSGKAFDIVVAVRDKFIERVKELVKVSDVTILEKAEESTTPYSPNITKTVVIAFLGSLSLGVIYLILREILNNKIVTPSDIKYDLGINLLGIVPKNLGTVQKNESKKGRNKNAKY